MFENVTYEELLESMLDFVPDTLDKREGSIIYNALAPAALELAQAYVELDVIMEETFATTASGEFLELRCLERGIVRKDATYALMKGSFDAEVSIGDRFSIDEYTFEVTEHISGNYYALQCEQTGSAPNTLFGELTPIQYIEWLTTATLTNCLIPGEDVESDDQLRQRYFNNISNKEFAGNKADYIAKTNAIDGVGATKVYPAWNGGGTVKLVILDSDYNAASSTLVESVQGEIDPNNGDGSGIAPIGHDVTVVAAGTTAVNIATTLTYEIGYNLSEILTNLQEQVDAYFLELKQRWESAPSTLVVRISQIESRFLDVTGVIDVTATKLNGTEANLAIDADKIPVRGTISENS